MDDYNTLFDSDLAEHDYIMSQPVKSPEVCAECAFFMDECDDVECDFCRQFDKPHGVADAPRYRRGRGASFLKKENEEK